MFRNGSMDFTTTLGTLAMEDGGGVCNIEENREID